MSGNKTIKNSLAEFFRYIRNELSGKDRNVFERELQKDPFADDAMDGFSLYKENEIEKDLLELSGRLNKRTIPGRNFALYRIAAVIAILVTVSVILIVNVRKEPEKQLALNEPEKKIFEIDKSQPIIMPESKDKVISDQTEEALNRMEQKSEKEGPEKSDKPAQQAKAVQTEVASESRATLSNENEVNKIVSAPMAAMARKKSDSYESAGASDSGEVSTSDYDSGKKDYMPGHILPEPLTGVLKFNEYIKNNLQRPVNSESGKKAVVILNFLVRSSGEIDSIKVIRSPGKQFSDEAIRVLKSGPAWKPAMNNGVVIDEDVSLRIVFR